MTAFAEELTRGKNAGVNMAMLVQCEMATPIINAIGTDEQKQLFLAPAITGEKIAALGISEPGAGSDVAQHPHRRSPRRRRLRHQRQQDVDHQRHALRLHHAGRAHRRRRLRRHLALTFPTDVKGFSVAKKLDKVGNLSSDTAVLFFEDCRVPRRFLLGDENQGFYHIMTNFQGERLVASIGACEGMQRMVEDAVKYGGEREAFGRPIIKFQVWRHKFAEYLARRSRRRGSSATTPWTSSSAART